MSSSIIEGTKKKRVCKACDSCRIKKTKCNGMKPCVRCTANNKICTYTERRRSKDKIYPAGYVELLETRLDILTKSMKKLFEMSESGENVSFLRSETTGELSINKLISQLIDKEELFHNQPVEWEYGTSLATDFREDDEEYLKRASAEFAEHSRNIIKASNSKRKTGKKGRGKYKRSKGNKVTPNINKEAQVKAKSTSSSSSGKSPISVKSEYDGLEKFEFNMNSGLFQSGSELATSANLNNGDFKLQISDFGSDVEDEYSSSFSLLDNHHPQRPLYKFPGPNGAEVANVSLKNNSVSNFGTIDSSSLQSPTMSQLRDLSTHRIQPIHQRIHSLHNPTMVTHPQTYANKSHNEPSIFNAMSPHTEDTKTNAVIDQAIKTRQSTMSHRQEFNCLQQPKMQVGFNDVNDFSEVLGNLVEPTTSRLINCGTDDFFVNNNPIPYNV